MTIPQRNLISEFDIEKWRVRRHPKKRDTIEIYIDPDVLDSRKRFMFELLFQS